MKNIAISIVFVVFGLFYAKAEHKDSPVKGVYQLYVEDQSCESIYVTNKMVALRLREAAPGSDNKDFISLIENFHEFILIGCENGQKIPLEDINALRSHILGDNYEQIVRISDDGESLTAYLLEDKKSEKILDLIIIAIEDDEQMILSISGNLTMKEIGLVSSLFDINIFGMLNL